MDLKNNKFMHRHLYQGIIDSVKGIANVLRTQKNFKIDFFLTIIAISLCFLLSVSKFELLFVVLMCGIMLSFEIFNTAIEYLCNVIDESYNLRIKIIKDVSSGAVLVMSFFTLINGVIIFGPKLINLVWR